MYQKIKILLCSIVFVLAGRSFAACTTISRTNNAANSVLTSTKLNADFNAVYSAVNSLDGECLQAGSVGIAALDTSSLGVVFETPHIGCLPSFSSASTISISKCRLAIGSNLVDKTTATTVSFGCGSCSAEVASTTYYVYALSTSTASTLNLLISTTAPDENGMSSGNRVLGSFFNNSSSDIETLSVAPWKVNSISNQKAHDGSNGEYVLVPYYYQLVTADASYTSGTIHVSRVGDVVTLTADSTLGHASLDTASSNSNLLPSWADPGTNVTNVYAASGTIVRVITVDTSRAITTQYYTWAGAGSAQVGSGVFTITYSIK